MKSLKIAAALLFTGSLAYSQQVTVEGNSKVNTDFSKYKTYAWSESDQTAQSDEGYEVYSYAEKVTPSKGGSAHTKNKKQPNNKSNQKGTKNPTYIYSYEVIIPSSNATTNSTIKKAIAGELEGRGYRNSAGNADLLVAYKVLEKNAKFRGYNNDDPTVVNGTQVRQPSDTTTYFLKPGTLLISLIDTKTSVGVWDGFASGLVQDNTFTADPVKLEEAIHLIFEQFKYRADSITETK